MKRACIGIAVCVAVIGGMVFGSGVFGADDVLVGTAAIPGDTNPLPGLGIFVGAADGQGTLTVRREIATQMPANWDFGSPAYVYRVSSDVAVSGPFFICLSFDPERFVVPNGQVRLIQIDGTEAVNFTRRYTWTEACGTTDHLSSFAAAQPFGVTPTTFTRDSSGRTSATQYGADAAISYAASPHTAFAHFSSAPGNAVLTIVNGSVPTTGAQIKLNGMVAGASALFKKNKNYLSIPVLLLPGENALEVSIDGSPGSFFSLSIQR